ncbi:N-acetylglucosamine kinase [Brachybacterium phenoliresistens]|nr:BadF/BadG/BcrA/BcrD ATPase family protein [Brachybacterium phenoliresistens]
MADPDPAPSSSAVPGLQVLGADVGATRARVRIRALGPHGELGTLLASAEGPGYNPNSSGPDGPAGLVDAVRTALLAAQAGARLQAPVRTVAVLGIAGAAAAHHAQVEEVVRAALAPLGLPARDVSIVDDMLPAFAAGSAHGEGLLLLGGTGSAAVRFSGFAPVRRCDGMGWLLGDTGSAVWIGREVLQAAACDLDGRGPATALTADVLAELGLPVPRPGAPRDGSGDDVRQGLIAAVRPLAPAHWGRLAPIAQRHPRDGIAREILARAAAELVAKVDAVRDGAAEIVLAGSVLSENPEVSRRVRAELADRQLEVLEAGPPVEGALRLAAQRAAEALRS